MKNKEIGNMDNTINKDVITFFIKLLLYDYKHYKPDEQLIEIIVKHIISLDNSD